MSFDRKAFWKAYQSTIFVVASILLSGCLEQTTLQTNSVTGVFAGATQAADLNASTILISWTPVSGVSNYEVYQVLDAAMDLSPIASVPGTSNTYTVSNLAPYTRESFIVRAIDATGNSDGNTKVVSTITFGGASSAVFTTINTFNVSITNPTGLGAAASLNIYGLFAGSTSYQLIQSSAPTASISNIAVPSGKALQKVLVRMVDSETFLEDSNTVLVTPITPSPTIASPATNSNQVIGQGTAATTLTVSGNCTYGGNVTISTALGTGSTATCSFSGSYSGTVSYTPLTTGADTITVSELFGGGVYATNNATINLEACPTGYVLVPSDSSEGTSNFCMSKYPMKVTPSGVPVSQPTWPVGTSSAPGIQWAGSMQGVNVYTAGTEFAGEHVTFAMAQEQCSSLGSHYHVTTNAEWMTAAHNGENVGANWYNNGDPTLNNLVGVGDIVGDYLMGCGGNNHAEYPQDPSGDSNGYYGIHGSDLIGGAGITFPAACLTTGNGCANTGYANWKRTWTLSNGEILWDLGGMGPTWVDLDGHGGTLNLGNESTQPSLMTDLYNGNPGSSAGRCLGIVTTDSTLDAVLSSNLSSLGITSSYEEAFLPLNSALQALSTSGYVYNQGEISMQLAQPGGSCSSVSAIDLLPSHIERSLGGCAFSYNYGFSSGGPYGIYVANDQINTTTAGFFRCTYSP